jgi:intein/homing endonuclease
MEYKTTPVDMETFVKDPFYLGHTCDNLYPVLLEALTELFEGGYQECVFTGSIGYGKCAELFSSLVTDLDTGERGSLASFVGKTPKVASLQDDGSIGGAVAARIWKSGQKPCVKVTLASGQWLKASTDHPLLTPTGWRPLKDLVEGDLIATARSVPSPTTPLAISDDEVQAIAFFMTDGCGLHFGHQTYCKGDPVLVELFKKSAATLPGFTGFGAIEFKKGAWYVPCHGLRPWLASWGLDEASKHKRVPGKLFGLNDQQTALLLRTLWTDGSIYLGTPGRLEIGLASEGLIDDLQELLLRFGICARKSYKLAKIKIKDGLTKEYDSWKLQIAAADHLTSFFDKIGFLPGKEQDCAQLSDRARATKTNTNWDVVPITTQELKSIRSAVGPLPNSEWLPYGSLAAGSCMSRAKFQRLVEHFNYKGKYAKYAHMDVSWERVASIEDIGIQEVGDLTVPGPANAVCNGIIIHNTFTASIGICRILYELSCMVDPHRSFGLAKDSNISILALSVSEALATKVVFENVVTKIDASPYFRENFPFDKTKKELRFPNHVWVASRATTDTSALGLNTIAGLLDECLHGDALILLADGSVARAEDLNYADAPFLIKTLEFRDTAIPRRVGARAHIKASTVQECFELLFDNDRRLRVSGNHPVFVRRGEAFVDDLVRADKLELGDVCISEDLSTTILVARTSIGFHQTYDISVPDHEVFFADGLLVHNTNFMPKVTGAKANDPRFAGMDRAEVIYNAIKRRMTSRFEKFGKLPGCLFIMSSKATQDDFTARRINESKFDASIFVLDKALWDVKPEDYYKVTKFHVLAGNEQIPSRLLLKGEEETLRGTLPEGCVIIDVPEDFKPQFERDLEGSIRDLAGISTLSISPFIQRREKIEEAIDKTRRHPFSTLIYDASRGGMFLWDLMVQPTRHRKYGRYVEEKLPIINPQAPRHIHVDPSLRKDALGFCMSHIGGWVDVLRSNPENPRENYKERAPYYIVDLVLRVLPPTGGEIILGDIRRMIYEITAHGFLVTTVSMDSFNSADGLQQLAQKGYNALDISVDVTPDPYDNLKTALYENRIQFYEYQPLLDELRTIEQKWNAQKKRKIDHPPKKSKDISDALAGCLWTLSQGAPHAQPMAPMKSLPAPTGDEAWLEEQRQAELANQRGASKNTSLADYGLLPPFLTGGDEPDDPFGGRGGGGWNGGSF